MLWHINMFICVEENEKTIFRVAKGKENTTTTNKKQQQKSRFVEKQ